MARKPNRTARLLVPLIAGAIGLAAAWAMFKGGQQKPPAPTAPATPTAPAPTDPASDPSSPSAGDPGASDGGQEAPEGVAPGETQPVDSQQASGAGAATEPVLPPAEPDELGARQAQTPEQTPELAPGPEDIEPAIAGLRAELVEPGPLTPIGGLDPDAGDRLAIAFSDLGAGIDTVQLADYFESVKRQNHLTIQHEHTSPSGARLTPLAAYRVEIDGQWVLIGSGPDEAPVWREVGPGAFEAHLIDAAGERIARITRTYEIVEGTHAVRLRQSVTNLTDAAMTVAWQQVGPSDLPADRGGYGGDKRRVRFGYVAPNWPGNVVGNDYLVSRDKAVGPVVQQPNGARLLQSVRQLWPNDRASRHGYQLTWVGMTNRYFGLAMYPLQESAGPPVTLALPEAALVERVVSNRVDDQAPIALLTTSAPVEAAPGAEARFDMMVFAGPLAQDDILSSPGAEVVNLGGLVQYNFGGPCAFCTFGWITHALIGLLNLLHNYLVFDWSLAIILLVVVVRTVLHPVTKWSQIRLTRFGKQMQEMAPKQKKIQEKYKDDPKKVREEMSKLWREEGINPAGALGCLPMFLQTPVWIALYASLYFAVQLRQEPAFFGVFQKISGGSWEFMADLSRADAFLPLPASFEIPLMGEISSLNVLPLLLGIVFFIHQKYMSPPPSATMTPEQKQQQRMMKIMMVVMFPVIMYNAPCGLSLYFIANSTLGIFESRYIRAHVTKLDLQPKKTGPTMFQRVMEQAERRRQAVQGGQSPKSFGRAGPGGQGRGRGGPAGSSPGKRSPRR